MASGVYEIRNTKSGKAYVGSTKDLNKRERKHFQALDRRDHPNPILQKAYDKHGEKAMEFRVLEETDRFRKREQELLDTEQYFPPDGYNVLDQATGGDTWSNHPNREQLVEEAKKYNSGESNGMHGKEHSEAARDRMREQADGRFTLQWFQDRYGGEEGRRRYEKRCEQRSEWLSENNPMDKPEHRKKLEGERSEEVKQKLSEKLSGRDVTWGDKISESKQGQLTGSDNPNHVSVDRDRMRQLIADGLIVAELENKLGCSKKVIYDRLDRMGFSGLREARHKLS